MTDDVPSRLAALKDRSTLQIVTRGRRTGRPHAKVIWFVVDGRAIYLGTLNAKRDWVRNAQKNPDVELELPGLRLRGRLSTITDANEDARVHRLRAGKYWAAWIGSWFGMGPERTFRVDGLAAAP